MKIKNFHHKVPSLIPSILLFLILLIILSIFQFRALHQNAQKMQELTNVMNKQTAIRIENWISMRITLVKLLAKSLNHADHVNPQLFKTEAYNLIITYPGFQAINWIDADGTVRIVLPFESNKRVLNKNLYFHPNPAVHRALQKAKETGSLATASSIKLLQGGHGLTVYVPVFKNESQLMGFVNGVFRIDTLIHYCLHDPYLNSHFNYLIVNENSDIIFQKGNILLKNEAFNRFLSSHTIKIGDSYWTVNLYPTQSFIRSELSFLNNQFFFFNLAFSLIIAFLIWLLILRNRKVAQKEAYFRTLFDAANTWIHILSPEGTILNVNPAFLVASGLSFSQVINKDYATFLTEWSRPRFKRVLADLENTKKFRIEWAFKFKNNEIRHIDCSGSVISDPSHRPSYIILHQIDITEQKKYQQDLNESEHRYRSVVENSPDPILIYDGSTVVYANPAALNLFQASTLRALQKKPLRELIHPDSRADVKTWIKNALRERKSPPLIHEKFLRFDGSVVEAEVTATIIKHKRKTQALVIIHDITKRIKAEKALQHSEQMLKSILTSMSDRVFLVDEVGHILFYNTPDSTNEELDFKQFTDKSILEVLPPAIIKRGENAVKQLQHKPVVNFEFYRTDQNGRKKWFSANISRMPTNEKPTRFVVVIRDITQAKEDEFALKRALEEKEILLQEVHHRVKNNLQSLQYLTQQSIQRINTQKDKNGIKIFHELQSQIEAMSLVYEQLYHTKNLAEVEISIYLTNLVRHIQESFSRDDVQLTYSFDSLTLPVDKALPLGMIVNELVSNAYKYAFPENFDKEKIIRIRMNVSNTYLKIEISDTGVGYPRNKDLKNTNSSGLKLVRLWIEHQLGGSCRLQNDHGAKISIQLPIK